MYSDNQSWDGNEGDLRKDFHKLPLSEQVNMLNRLHSLLIDYLGEQASQPQSAPAPTPAPETPAVEEAPQYDVTAKQRRRLAAFDDMTDADQLDQLKAMWGES